MGQSARNGTRAGVVVLLIVAMIMTLPGGVEAADGERAGGIDRVATAVRIATEAFPDGSANVVLARADDYPDALTATSLAGVLDAPVLLTYGDSLPSDTLQAIQRLRPQEIFLLGGSGAVSLTVENVLLRNYIVRRVSGGDRYGTAAAIARDTISRNGGEVGTYQGRTTVLMASAESFADTLTGAPLAYGNNLPVLLTRAEAMPTSTRAALTAADPEAVIILGGTAAISGDVATSIQAMGIEVSRIGGNNRSETSLQFNEFVSATFDQERPNVIVARGDNFPDALVGATLAGRASTPIILADSPAVLGRSAETYLRDRCGRIEQVQALGGNLAVSESVLNRAVGLATDCP